MASRHSAGMRHRARGDTRAARRAERPQPCPCAQRISLRRCGRPRGHGGQALRGLVGVVRHYAGGRQACGVS